MYIIRVKNKPPKRHSWVGLMNPVAKRRHAKVFDTRKEAEDCVKELKAVYKSLTAEIIAVK